MVDSVLPGAEHEWWYLPMIGVSPQAQGKGVGKALLGAKVAEVAATTTGVPGRGGRAIALYTESPGNIAFYNKLGFALRAHKVYDLPSGEVWENMFLSYPADAAVGAA
jgi:GNAT superfamily N-acetyltransferase